MWKTCMVESLTFVIVRSSDCAILKPKSDSSFNREIIQLLISSILTTRPQTPSPKAPLPLGPWDKHSLRDDNRTPITPAAASAENYRSNLLSLAIPETPPSLPRLAAIRESCKPWQSPQNPDCRSDRSPHRCARRKAAAIAAPYPDTCYRQ